MPAILQWVLVNSYVYHVSFFFFKNQPLQPFKRSPFLRLVGRKPILSENFLWFSSFEGGKKMRKRKKNVGGRRKVWGGRSILREEHLEGGALWGRSIVREEHCKGGAFPSNEANHRLSSHKWRKGVLPFKKTIFPFRLEPFARQAVHWGSFIKKKIYMLLQCLLYTTGLHQQRAYTYSGILLLSACLEQTTKELVYILGM